MDFDDIYRFFQSPPPTYLSKEQAVCYVLDVLLKQDSYATELIDWLKQAHPRFRVSDTILHRVLEFLESSGTISGYWQKAPDSGRGRPRRMYRLLPEARSRAEDLSRLWQESLDRRS